MKKLPVLALAGILACSITFAASLALAEGFGLYEWSARGVALGGATMARKADPSVISSNPAAITRLSGAQVQAGFTAVMPYGKYTVDSGSSATDPAGNSLAGKTYEVKDKIWPIPNVYYTQQVNDKLFLGVGEFSRFGLGFKYDSDWAGRYNIYDASVQTASVNPNIAYKITDQLSVAAGLEIMYVDITLKKKMPSALGDIDFDNNVKNWEHAWNVALHFQLNEQWAFGVAYRHRLKHTVDGSLKVEPSNPLLAANGIMDQDFTATVYMPASASFGVAFSPTPKLSIEAGGIWTRWSQFTDLDFQFEYLGKAENKKYWKNAWRLNLGVEYALNDLVDLRAGYVWDECPVNDRYEDYLIPTNDRHIYSVGAGFKPGNWTIDVAYAFVNPNDRKYGSDKPVTTRGNGTVKGKVHGTGSHIVSLSVGYKF